MMHQSCAERQRKYGKLVSEERTSLIDLWRKSSNFERILSIYCVTLTVGVIAYSWRFV